ncbi:MAG: HupE/UreJ family protein [Vulcanococcus sp.]
MTQRPTWLLPVSAAGLLLLSAAPASAHHLMELFHQQQPTPLAGLLSGLGHPLLGQDHLLFLLALALVGLQRSSRWMLGLLAVGLLGTLLGLLTPQLPAAELLVALTLVVEGLVVIGRLPAPLLVPCFALHGYVLSAAVVGWDTGSVGAYLVGLLLSQGALLLLSLGLLRRTAAALAPTTRTLLAGGLMGIGAAFGWSLLVP